jgi:hypothetical protein
MQPNLRAKHKQGDKEARKEGTKQSSEQGNKQSSKQGSTAEEAKAKVALFNAHNFRYMLAPYFKPENVPPVHFSNRPTCSANVSCREAWGCDVGV